MSAARDDGGDLTHLGESGEARMVDVGGKAETFRRALARGRIRMAPDTLERIVAGDAPKGDVLGTARLAGIQAGKRTGELIPLCHVIPGASISVSLEADPELPGIVVLAEASVTGRTGVEMEALVAAAVALLTVYDMAKALERGMVLEDVRLVSKEGGRSGVWAADDASEGSSEPGPTGGR